MDKLSNSSISTIDYRYNILTQSIYNQRPNQPYNWNLLIMMNISFFTIKYSNIDFYQHLKHWGIKVLNLTSFNQLEVKTLTNELQA